MKLSDVEFQGDGKKATFFYTADDRVDFRELIKRLADEFRIRVEMRQIGMRQEAGRLGGIGVCGRELCCATWLTDFKTVSTSAARYQNLALNPAKLAGQCTKLKCCLNYELDSYMDALSDFPSTSVVLETEKGRAFHRKSDIFKRLVWYAFTIDDRREQKELSEGGDGGNWVVLSVDRVKEIIQLNKNNQKPAELALPEDDIKEVEPDYTNVVGQDSIDRMDKLKKKKKKKKKKTGERPVGQVAGQPQEKGTDQPRPIQPRQNQQRQNQPRPNPSAPNQPRPNPPRQNPPRQSPSGQNPGEQNPPQQNPPTGNPPRTNPPRQNPPRQSPSGQNPGEQNPGESNPPQQNQPPRNQPRPQHNKHRRYDVRNKKPDGDNPA